MTKTWDSRSITFHRMLQLGSNEFISLSVNGAYGPQSRSRVFSLSVIASHEVPKEIVEWLVFECILRRGYSKRDVIQTRKRPCVTHPTRQECDDSWRIDVCGQRGSISKGDFHLRRLKLTFKHFSST